MNQKPKIKIIGAELSDILKSASPESKAAFKRKPYLLNNNNAANIKHKQVR